MNFPARRMPRTLADAVEESNGSPITVERPRAGVIFNP